MKIKGKINGEKMGGNGWGGTWGLGLVGTRELKKKICGHTLYARPPSPSSLSLLPACSCGSGCGWLWGGANDAQTRKTPHKGVFVVFEGWVGVQEHAKHEKHVHWTCFSCWRLGWGQEHVMLEGWRGSHWWGGRCQVRCEGWGQEGVGHIKCGENTPFQACSLARREGWGQEGVGHKKHTLKGVFYVLDVKGGVNAPVWACSLVRCEGWQQKSAKHPEHAHMGVFGVFSSREGVRETMSGVWGGGGTRGTRKTCPSGHVFHVPRRCRSSVVSVGPSFDAVGWWGLWGCWRHLVVS